LGEGCQLAQQLHYGSVLGSLLGVVAGLRGRGGGLSEGGRAHLRARPMFTPVAASQNHHLSVKGRWARLVNLTIAYTAAAV
jgi:hypothetical protein